MPDREKVMKGLECCRPIWFESVKCKNKCPYDVYGHDEGGCVDHLISDAISLLKEQQSSYERGKRDGVSQYLREREEDEEYEY